MKHFIGKEKLRCLCLHIPASHLLKDKDLPERAVTHVPPYVLRSKTKELHWEREAQGAPVSVFRFLVLFVDKETALSVHNSITVPKLPNPSFFESSKWAWISVICVKNPSID